MGSGGTRLPGGGGGQGEEPVGLAEPAGLG